MKNAELSSGYYRLHAFWLSAGMLASLRANSYATGMCEHILSNVHMALIAITPHSIANYEYNCSEIIQFYLALTPFVPHEL